MNFEKIAEVANGIDNAIRENATLKTLVIDASSDLLGDQSGETRQSIQDFLDSSLQDKKELAMKKAYAAAVVLAKERGLLPAFPESSSEIAAIVDDSLSRVKLAYKVGIGILDPEEAIDQIIDHAESRAIAYVDKVFDSGLVREAITEGIVKFAYAIPEIGPVLGPIAESHRPIIKSVISKVEAPVKSIIKKGIHVVSTTAKKIAHSAVEKTKEFASSFTNTVKDTASSWFSKIF